MAEKRVFSVIPTTRAATGTITCADGVTTRIPPLASAIVGAGATLTNFQQHTGVVVVGSIGIFDANTLVTVAATGVAGAFDGLDLFIVVATDQAVPAGSAGTGFLIRKSKTFSRANVTAVTNQAQICSEAKVAILDGFTAECDTEYCIKIRYESEAIKQTYGYQDLVKTYTYTTSCCGDDCACPDGDCAELAYGIAKAVNDDPDNLVTAVAETDTAIPGTWVPIVEADFATGILCTDVRVTFTGQTGSFFDGCGPNPMVKDFVNNDFYIGLTCGFECNGTITDDGTGDSNTIVFEQGIGEQVQNLEEYAGGYSRKFGIYRIPFPRTVVDKLAVAGVAYDVVQIIYNDVHDSANTLGQVASPEKVIVAVDNTDAIALAGSF